MSQTLDGDVHGFAQMDAAAQSADPAPAVLVEVTEADPDPAELAKADRHRRLDAVVASAGEAVRGNDLRQMAAAVAALAELMRETI